MATTTKTTAPTTNDYAEEVFPDWLLEDDDDTCANVYPAELAEARDVILDNSDGNAVPWSTMTLVADYNVCDADAADVERALDEILRERGVETETEVLGLLVIAVADALRGDGLFYPTVGGLVAGYNYLADCVKRHTIVVPDTTDTTDTDDTDDADDTDTDGKTGKLALSEIIKINFPEDLDDLFLGDDNEFEGEDDDGKNGKVDLGDIEYDVHDWIDDTDINRVTDEDLSKLVKLRAEYIANEDGNFVVVDSWGRHYLEALSSRSTLGYDQSVCDALVLNRNALVKLADRISLRRERTVRSLEVAPGMTATILSYDEVPEDVINDVVDAWEQIKADTASWKHDVWAAHDRRMSEIASYFSDRYREVRIEAEEWVKPGLTEYDVAYGGWLRIDRDGDEEPTFVNTLDVFPLDDARAVEAAGQTLFSYRVETQLSAKRS